MFKYINIIILMILFCFSSVGHAGEYWFDSNLPTEDAEGTPITGNGSKANPWRTMTVAENNINPGDVHTLHFKGSPIAYAGGFGGYNFKRYLFYNCIITRDTSEHPMLYTPTKSIRFRHLSDGVIAGTKEFLIHPKFNIKGKRFYVDTDNALLVLTHPFYIEGDSMRGFKWDSVNHKVIVVPDLVLNKPMHEARRAKIKAMKADWAAYKASLLEVASNPALLDEISIGDK